MNYSVKIFVPATLVYLLLVLQMSLNVVLNTHWWDKAYLKLQDRSRELGCAPVPALHTELHVQHFQAVGVGEMFCKMLPLLLLESGKPLPIEIFESTLHDIALHCIALHCLLGASIVARTICLLYTSPSPRDS